MGPLTGSWERRLPRRGRELTRSWAHLIEREVILVSLTPALRNSEMHRMNKKRRVASLSG
jgi:hypothetical protein